MVTNSTQTLLTSTTIISKSTQTALPSATMITKSTQTTPESRSEHLSDKPQSKIPSDPAQPESFCVRCRKVTPFNKARTCIQCFDEADEKPQEIVKPQCMICRKNQKSATTALSYTDHHDTALRSSKCESCKQEKTTQATSPFKTRSTDKTKTLKFLEMWPGSCCNIAAWDGCKVDLQRKLEKLRRQIRSRYFKISTSRRPKTSQKHTTI